MDLIEQVRLFPSTPGVYIMKDSSDNVIYVGKAKRLKNRVIQYFYHKKDRAPKIDEMVEKIHVIEYILTDTELEAFLTECRLIKELKPMYNSQMKNDKRYVYIKININEKYPGISIAAKKDEADSLFFGPYSSRSSVERVVDFIKEHFLIRKCGSGSFVKKASGCLNYSLGMCMGVCREDADYDAYRECINNIVMFLEGRDNSVIESLKEKIALAADRLEFEKAAKYRDDLRAINHVLNKQSVIQSSSRKRNVIAVEAIGRRCYKVFLFKGNRLIGTESFSADNTDRTSAVEYFYDIIIDNFKNKSLDMDKTLSKWEIDEAQIIYSYLKLKKNDIMSFWIPNSWLEEDNPRLRAGLHKIVSRIFRTQELKV